MTDIGKERTVDRDKKVSNKLYTMEELDGVDSKNWIEGFYEMVNEKMN